jgi:hypothetical protein
MSPENSKESKYNASSCHNSEPDGNTANAHFYWIMAIDVE